MVEPKFKIGDIVCWSDDEIVARAYVVKTIIISENGIFYSAYSAEATCIDF